MSSSEVCLRMDATYSAGGDYVHLNRQVSTYAFCIRSKSGMLTSFSILLTVQGLPISRNHWDGSFSWDDHPTRSKQGYSSHEIQVPWAYAHGFHVQQRLDCHTGKLNYCRSLLQYILWLFFWNHNMVLDFSSDFVCLKVIQVAWCYICLCLYLINEIYLLYLGWRGRGP